MPPLLRLLPLPLLAACSTRPALSLNEVMADNETTLADGATGEYLDWIELYNAGDEPLALGGFYLTDDLDAPTAVPLSARLTIAAGGFLLLWAAPEEDPDATHLGFGLSADGEDLGLFWEDPETGNVLQLDALAFGPQAPDVSWARGEDGVGPWLACDAPTPGTSNR
jgi:hypothetical protein